MTLSRRVETFVAGYIGFTGEAIAAAAEKMDDLGAAPGAGPGKQNFYVANRTKQYWDMKTLPVVRNGGTPVVNSGATAYTYQRLGGIVRFAQPQTLTQTDDVQTITATGATGTFLWKGTDENGVVWTSTPISATATSGNVTTAIGNATPSVVSPGYTNPFAGTNLTAGGGALGTTAVTLTGAAGLKGQYLADYVLDVSGITAGTVAVAHTTQGGTGITVDFSYCPMYFLKGGRNLGNNSTAQKIDTTGSGDARQNGVPGRPDDEMSFGLVAGPKITLVNGTIRTIENRLLQARDNAEACVMAFVDDITDPVWPRDVMYGFIGTANKTRQLGQVVERQVSFYAAVPDDGTLAVVNLDYLA